MLETIASQNINAAVQELRDRRELPGQLTFLSRTPLTPALDSEILAYVTSDVHIADVVPDDVAARVYGGEKIRTELTELPNIKHGRHVTQARLELLRRVAMNATLPGEAGDVMSWLNGEADKLVLGVRQRMEQMIVGMALGSWTYSRNGVVVGSAVVDFGTPSDLSVTASTLWSDSANATPVADLQALVALAREKYGKQYRRATLNSATFREMIATTEFRNKATLYSQLVLPAATNFPTADIAMMTVLAERVTGLQIELKDEKYAQEQADGSITRTNFIPNDKVALSDPDDDNNADAYDFGNGYVTETLVGGGASVLGQMPDLDRGPVAYTTVSPTLNPPDVTLWGVARGFPRLKDKAAFATLTV